jgi:hypothetical protein
LAATRGEHEKKAIAAEIMARLRESGCFDGEVLDSPTAFSDVGPTPTPRITVGFSKGNSLSRSGHWWRPLALAGSLLLMVALPVLALVGLHKLYIPSLDPESFAPHPKQSVPPEASGAATVPLDTAPAAKSAASPSDSTPVNWDQTSRIALDILTEDALRRVELEALLPATEEEYEVWAREEYPHIMALYDILVEATEDQPNITALWDGTPVHIPDWARRLYVDTPEDKRPMGWRALLIYSGEVFKFDWPTRTTDPNCRPTLEAMQHVASVAGFVLRFAEDGQYGVSFSPHAGIGVDEHRFTLRALEASPSVWVLPSQNPSENYVASALNNHSVAEAALRYLITSSHLVQLPPFESLSLSGTTLLTSSIASPMSKCDVATRASLLNDFL